MGHRTTESRYASKHDCPVGDVVFGGFAPSPMGSIQQTPEMAKEAEDFWKKANEARAKAAAKLRQEIAGTWLENSEQILKEAIRDAQRIQAKVEGQDRGTDAGGNRQDAA